ncbi:hypothetical protein EPA93_13265 [Ktedonosporobacter rubrisoli]|uniref:Nucleotide-diphospho-sugar transferase domain-containing protein n=1 Tax=Ktedonosporobacter rubrisoli TaxID=2509675 RepID=A0A4V0YYP3_KTERU|nr:hypothetical protein [Ktedonosporobacter rubrisoli]QBD76921.1 hypothetical protein EPA93_13265 [Ktedonosporobacter rubrisoli]
MYTPPFTLVSCSWPRPVEQVNGQWTSLPEWDALPMSMLPQTTWGVLRSDLCLLIDWGRFFDGQLRYWGPHSSGGQMRGFHIVFRLRINESGTLVFWHDNGCIIRQNKRIVYADTTSHPLSRHTLEVKNGDDLEVAQWQQMGNWHWGARIVSSDVPSETSHDLLRSYLPLVVQRLSRPNGPPLKMYFDARMPFSTVLAIYSMILNGYQPSQVLIFGDYQWNEEQRRLYASLLPFAQIIPTQDVLAAIGILGGQRLVEWARRYWFVMKTCIGVLYPPEVYCFMDDDVFVLDPLDDALAAFEKHNLVFVADQDHSKEYLDVWGRQPGQLDGLSTGCINTGLYWLRNLRDPRELAASMLTVSPLSRSSWQMRYLWDQGFVARQFAHEAVYQLPSQRYFYPYLDGLPGGMLGYDYAQNPCGFACIHFGAVDKPTDEVALLLTQALLGAQGVAPDQCQQS